MCKRLGKGLVWCVVGISLLLTVLLSSCSCSGELDHLTYPKSYSELVEAEAANTGVDPHLVYAIMKAESSFDPKAKSHAGAIGLMQVMPATVEWMRLREGETTLLTEEEIFLPENNIHYGVAYLAYLQELFDTPHTIAAAYNAGFAAVEQWLQDGNYSTDGKTLSKIPYAETDNYAKKVEAFYEKYNTLYP